MDLSNWRRIRVWVLLFKRYFRRRNILCNKREFTNQFLQLKKKYIDWFTLGKKANEVDEDLLVFLKMICVGVENL